MIAHLRARKLLLIASGGCTALTLAAADPSLELTLLDPNPAQHALLRRKLDAIASVSGPELDRAFNVGDDSPEGLNACGNFESLFRQFRAFLMEFVAPRERLFELATLQASHYWPVAFDLHFSDSLLNAMFGPDATQHAPKGSYPAYFRGALERGLARPDARDNPFLQHILLGHTLARPSYLDRKPAAKLDFIEGTLDQVEDLGRFDLIGLSNIFDWMPRAEIERIASRLSREARPGSGLIFRQLNHVADLKSLFAYRFETDLEERLLEADRSLFYSKLNLGVKT